MKRILFTILIAFSVPAHAATDALIEGAKLCTRHLPRYEREYGIPVHLLSAISSTESGRYHKGLGLALPWPWTINAEGKGYYLNSKQEAVQMARKLQAQGVKSMDVGCMQVNLMHHAQAFRSLEEAFEPQYNIRYAASFLRNLYQEDGSWKEAAAAYHSKTPERGIQYVSRVFDKWHQIIEKLRMAQTVVAATGPAGVTVSRPVETAKVERPVKATPAVSQAPRLAEQAGRTVKPREPVHMKTIEVASAKPKRESGVLVIRPQPAVAKSTDSTVEMAQAVAHLSPSASGAAKAEPAAHKSAPRFIFTD